MSNLENITQKILDEASAQVEELHRERDAIEETVLADSLKKAQALREQMLEKAVLEAEQLKERHLSGAALKARDMTLAAKQAVMDRVFEQAKEQMEKLGDEDYLRFLTQTVKKLSFQGEEQLLVEESRLKAVQELKLPLPVATDRFVASGFQVKTPKMTLNFNFSDLVDALRQEVEADLLGLLFKKGE